MATTEERMKILNMIREGKISAEEGAKPVSYTHLTLPTMLAQCSSRWSGGE